MQRHQTFEIRGYWHGSDTSGGVEEAIRYSKNDFLVQLLSRRLASDPKLARRDLTGIQNNWLILTYSETRFLFSEGSRNTLAHLSDNGALHPDGLENRWELLGSKDSRPSHPITLLINHALHGRRRDLVRILLDKGANINARAGGTQWGFKSPLQEAVDVATTPETIHDVQFLIEQGADPATVQEGPLLALEHCCIADRYLKTVSARPYAEKWHDLWQTERNGRLKPL